MRRAHRGRMQRMAKPKTRGYPRRAEIERVVAAVRASGVEIGAVSVGPDGTIRVSETGLHSPSSSLTDFDRWEADGRL